MLIPEPELAPDLEWMLLSTQASPQMLVEAVVNEHGVLLYRIALSILDDQRIARRALKNILKAVVTRRDKYREEIGVRPWLVEIAIDVTGKVLAGWVIRRAWRAVFKPARRSSYPMGPQPEGKSEVELWLAVDALARRERLVYLLAQVHALPMVEIAKAMKSSPQDIQFEWETAASVLERRVESGEQPAGEFNRWAALSLQRRWPESEIPFEAGHAPAHLKNQAWSPGSPRKAGKLLQLVWGVVLVGLVLFVGWLSSQLGPQGAALTLAPRTVVITQIVRVPATHVVTPTPAPRITPQPLSVRSSPLEIRARMEANRQLWDTLWADALLVRYGPPGYIGPVQAYRNQVWIQSNRPSGMEQRLVLSGEPGLRPHHALLVQAGEAYEIDLETGLSYSYLFKQPGFQLFNLPAYSSLLNTSFDLQSMQNGARLEQILIGSTNPDNPERVESVYEDVIGAEIILGRKVLVLERSVRYQDTARASASNGASTYEKFWVDTVTGLTLRWQKFSDPSLEYLLDEMVVTGLELEGTFPEEQLSSAFFWKKPVSWAASSTGGVDEDQFSAPMLNSRRPIRNNVPPPTGFNAQDSFLTFQWDAKADTSPIAEIFADGYSLGQLAMGAPENLLCQRSPDGSRIAYLTHPDGPGSLFFEGKGVFWFDLNAPAVQMHNALPNALTVGSSFAFSPDGTLLAFWGCGGRDDNCGVYLHNTLTYKNTKLYPIANGATFLTWSQDGDQLALVAVDQDFEYSTIFMVLDASNGRVLYQGPYAWSTQSLPPDPHRDWSIPFPPASTGLEACVGNP